MIMAQADTIGGPEELRADDAMMLLCWQCGAALAEMTPETRIGSGKRVCSSCGVTTQYCEGIWCVLSPGRIDHFRKFIAEYELIRAAERRGSADPEYYLKLPYKDLSGHNSDQWKIRSRTFRTIERLILGPLARLRKRPLRVLDLGAGNGWMSYRLTLQGHLPIAVDLLTNDRDGLGAAIHYSTHIRPIFPRIQAELDWLPFESSSFDLAIFNASFHYSENYERTFAEAMRCICPGGTLVIADTPWYALEDSGRKMVTEKHERFAAKYGFPSDSIASLEFLTPDRLRRLQEAFQLKWRVLSPFYGVHWSLRPLRAKLAGRRPPSHFRIYATGVNS
jgi:SAM-dependent methyltransferase